MFGNGMQFEKKKFTKASVNNNTAVDSIPTILI